MGGHLGPAWQPAAAPTQSKLQTARPVAAEGAQAYPLQHGVGGLAGLGVWARSLAGQRSSWKSGPPLELQGNHSCQGGGCWVPKRWGEQQGTTGL